MTLIVSRQLRSDLLLKLFIARAERVTNINFHPDFLLLCLENTQVDRQVARNLIMAFDPQAATIGFTPEALMDKPYRRPNPTCTV